MGPNFAKTVFGKTAAKGLKNATFFRPYLVKGVNWLGDAVMSLPALTALAKAGVPMKVLSRKAAAAIYQGFPMVSEVIAEETGWKGRFRTAMRLMNLRFSGALILTNSFSSALVALLGLVPDRTGYGRDLRSLLLSKPVKVRSIDLSVHQSFYFLRLVEAMGIPATFARPVLSPKSPDPSWGLPEGFKLAIAPGAAFGGAKRWPAQSFAAAALKIVSNRPGSVIILGGPGEASAAKEVEEALSGGPKVINLAGETTLSQAVSILAKCHLTLANDSGLMHLSGALDVPVVPLFGPTDPMITSPLSRRFAILRKPVPCSPCQKRECPMAKRACLDDLEPDLAVEAAFALLSPFQTGRGAVFWTPSRGEELPLEKIPRGMRLGIVGGNEEAVERAMGLDPGKASSKSGDPGASIGKSVADSLSQLRMKSLGQSFGQALRGTLGGYPRGFAKLRPLALDLPESGEIDWQAYMKAHNISGESSLWLGNTVESLAPAQKFGGRSALVMTREALPEIPSWRERKTPDIVAPSPEKALEWLSAMMS